MYVCIYFITFCQVGSQEYRYRYQVVRFILAGGNSSTLKQSRIDCTADGENDDEEFR